MPKRVMIPVRKSRRAKGFSLGCVSRGCKCKYWTKGAGQKNGSPARVIGTDKCGNCLKFLMPA